MNSLSKDDIDAGLAYCRWLHAKHFNAWLNKTAPDGAAWRDAGVCLNDRGKNIYAQVLASVKRQSGSTPLAGEGERKAVVHALAAMKDRAPSGARATNDRNIKRASLHLTSVTKFLSSGTRTIQGLASTDSIDRQGDLVVQNAGRWELPLPLLWQHKHDQPIGWVRTIEVRKDGLWITAELATGIGKADEAWAMIESRLCESFSIGFQAHEWEPLASGGKRFTAWTLLEISCVTIPANPDAKIRRGGRTDTPVKLLSVRNGVKLKKPDGSVRLIRRGQ